MHQIDFWKKLNRRIPIILLMLTLSELTLPAAFSSRESLPSEANKAASNTFRLGTYRRPASFDPFNSVETISAPLMHLIFNRLIRLDESGRFEPDLAKRWEISPDGLLYTFYLHEGVRFHDGSECTAEDVLSTFQFFSDPDVSPSRHKAYEVVQEWKVLSKFVFQVKLKKPYAPFLLNLWHAHIVPSHLFSQEFRSDLESFEKHPVGSGPFIFKRQSETGDVTLAANPEYFEGRPYLEEVFVKIYPSKEQIWTAFMRDEIDVLLYMSHDDYEAVKNNDAVHVFRVLPPGGYCLVFNMQDPLLGNLKIRTAVNLGINRKELLAVMEHGEGLAINSPFHPKWVPYSGDAFSISYDPEKARAMIRSEGYVEKDGRFWKMEEPLSFGLLVNAQNEFLIRMAKLLRQQLQEIGVSLQLKTFSDKPNDSRSSHKKLPDFQSYLFLFNMGRDPDVAGSYWESSGAYNWGHFKNQKLDGLFENARSEVNTAKRVYLYQQVQEIINQGKPAAFLYIPYVFHAMNDRIRNDRFFQSPYISFEHLRKVSVRSAQNERG